MAISIENVIDRVEAVNIGTATPSVQVRNVKIIIEDGVEVSKIYERRTIANGDDWSGEPEEVRNVCAIFLTA